MVTQLIRHERIETTVEKAKELRRVADKVVTYGKEGSERSKKLASEIIRGDEELFKLFTEMAHRYKFREGGYTRVIRSKRRDRDAAQMAFIEFVDRIGELRPARPPLKSFLPRSAEVLVQSKAQAEERKESEESIAKTDEAVSESDKPKPEDPKPKRFFGLF